jgi:hypothetical protein
VYAGDKVVECLGWNGYFRFIDVGEDVRKSLLVWTGNSCSDSILGIATSQKMSKG